MKTGKREEGRGNKTTQVYLRWVGVCTGTYFESAQDGPWDVVIDGAVIVVNAKDIVELETERRHLETSCLCSGLSLHMAEVMDGSVLGEWRPVKVAAEPATIERDGDAPDVCRCQCLIGGACARPVCTGAYKLERICPEDKGVCDRCAGAKFEPCQDAKQPLPTCPFCGSHDVEIEMPFSPGGDWWGRCQNCGAATGIFNTEAEAEAAWRRREAKPEEVSRGGAEGAETGTPLKRAAILSMELCDLLDALPKDDFMKAVNVLKTRLQLSALKAQTEEITGKAVAHG